MIADSPLLCIPPEVRILIYEYLLLVGGRTRIAIRNQPKEYSARKRSGSKSRRSAYLTLERSIARQLYETTYYFEGDKLHPEILAVNWQLRNEASQYLYKKHTFDFGADLEAVVPFLSDKTLTTRGLIQNIALQKGRSIGGIDTDSYPWAAACRFLRTLPNLHTFRIVVGGGKPQLPWDGPQQLTVSDIRLLYATRHESLEWVRELTEFGSVAKVEILADLQYFPQPTTTATIIFAAFSASIETSFVEFLQTDLELPARAVSAIEL